MKLIPLFLLLFSLSMCTTETTKQGKSTICDWEQPTSKLSWTMFKTTDKIAFTSRFQEIKITSFKKSQDLLTSFIGTKILVNTQNIQHNKASNKIMEEYLFGHMMLSNTIVFTIKSIDKTTNKAVVNIKMNNTNKDIYVNLLLQDNIIHLKGLLDLKFDFDAVEALYFYKTATSKDNKSKDGKNVLWPDVAFELVLKAKKKC
jgi:hypothetical protein